MDPRRRADDHFTQRWGMRFSPTIELGHVLQAVIMLAGLAGWALVGYQSIDRQLALHTAELKLVEQRLSSDEATTTAQLTQLRDSEQRTAGETRQALDKITGALADLRTLVAAQGLGHDGVRR